MRTRDLDVLLSRGEKERAWENYARLESNNAVDIYQVTVMLRACNGSVEQDLLLQKAKDNFGVVPTRATETTMLSTLLLEGEKERAQELVMRMEERSGARSGARSATSATKIESIGISMMGGVSDKHMLPTNVTMSREEEKNEQQNEQQNETQMNETGQEKHGSDMVLRTILARDQRSWSALRTKRLREMLEKEKDIVGAEMLLNTMARNGVADERQFAVVMHGGERESDGCSVRNHCLLERMVESGVPPTIRVYNAMLRQWLFEGLDVETMEVGKRKGRCASELVVFFFFFVFFPFAMRSLTPPHKLILFFFFSQPLLFMHASLSLSLFVFFFNSFKNTQLY